ncbi:MAG: hypothetical protein WAO55_12060 [Candidatus Manganitrophaceae bacterium]
MAKGVGADLLCQTGAANRRFDGLVRRTALRALEPRGGLGEVPWQPARPPLSGSLRRSPRPLGVMMDGSELRKEVFAWFGGAAYAAQRFEVELCILLLLTHRLKNPSLTPEQMDHIDTKLSKKTLGILLSELKKHTVIHPNFQMILDSYLARRNYLMHHFFFDHGQDLLSRDGCDKMTEELKGIYALLKEADEMAKTMSRNVRKYFGISETEIQLLTKAHLKEFSDEE